MNARAVMGEKFSLCAISFHRCCNDTPVIVSLDITPTGQTASITCWCMHDGGSLESLHARTPCPRYLRRERL